MNSKKEMTDFRFNLIGEQTKKGLFGEEAAKTILEYEKCNGNHLETFVKSINDFYAQEINPIFRPYPISLIKIILTLFIRNNHLDPDLSYYFTLIFKQDISGTKNTCIKDKFLNMVEANHASKQSTKINNQLIIWELTKNSFLAYNEFLNVLLGVILINYRFSIGKSYKISALNMNYGNKVKELTVLNPQDITFKYLIELLQPEIRNAIGHQSIWYNKEESIVTYYNDKLEKNQTISIKDFIYLNSKASYLAEAYIVAMSIIGLFTIAKPDDKVILPKELLIFLNEIILHE